MRIKRKKRSRLAGAVAAALAGGSLFGACEARVKDAVVNGSQAYLFSLMNPSSLGFLSPNFAGPTRFSVKEE